MDKKPQKKSSFLGLYTQAVLFYATFALFCAFFFTYELALVYVGVGWSLPFWVAGFALFTPWVWYWRIPLLRFLFSVALITLFHLNFVVRKQLPVTNWFLGLAKRDSPSEVTDRIENQIKLLNAAVGQR